MPDEAQIAPRILIVTVRYRMPVEASATLTSLASAFAANSALHRRYCMLLWDNSPEPLLDPPANMLYRFDPNNSGIAGACNGATAFAQESGCDWLLVLDQDSRLPHGFLEGMADAAVHVHAMAEVAAVVPEVYVRDVLASPQQVLFGRTKPYPAGVSGIAPGELTAVNSGSLLRVRDLVSVGGYSRTFPLDFSDWYIFHQFVLAGKKVWRAAELRLQHEMTAMDYDRLMSAQRYAQLLDAEEAFVDAYRCHKEGALQTARLLLRAATQRMKLVDPEFSRMSMQRFLRRLGTTRQQRLTAWRASVEARTRTGTAEN